MEKSFFKLMELLCMRTYLTVNNMNNALCNVVIEKICSIFTGLIIHGENPICRFEGTFCLYSFTKKNILSCIVVYVCCGKS